MVDFSQQPFVSKSKFIQQNEKYLRCVVDWHIGLYILAYVTQKRYKVNSQLSDR